MSVRDKSVYGETLNAFQHVLARPDVYLGTNLECTEQTMSVAKGLVVETRNVVFNQGIYHIVREITSNAIDHCWRCRGTDQPVTRIEFTANTETDTISIWNDGRGIPVHTNDYEYTDPVTQTKTKNTMYPAEAFFGSMFAGTNYDDNKVRKTSGRNGIGATLCNILSKSFSIEHTSMEDQKKFIQEYSVNGSVKTKPKITSYTNKKAYTCITFVPDYERFGCTGLWEDFVDALNFHAIEIAMITGIPVRFNGQLIKIPSVDKFAKMIYPTTKSMSIEAPNGDQCTIICIEPSDDTITTENVTHHSYVNGCRTSQGGIHVVAWRDAIVSRLVRILNARKSTKAKPVNKMTAKHIYPHLHLVVRVEVDRPDFGTGNVKDYLTRIYNSNTDSSVKESIPYTFHATYPYTNKEEKEWSEYLQGVIESMVKWPMVAKIDALLNATQVMKLDKAAIATSTLKTRSGHNFNDAKHAGGKNRDGTMCFLVEGLSAATLVVSGISKLPESKRGKYGYIALKGKLINVTKSTKASVLANEEIKLIIGLFGLQFGVDYADPKVASTLRYRHAVLFTDADYDGRHIKGLILNFFYSYFPSIFSIKDFFLDYLTPNVIVELRSPKETKPFYALYDYERWYKESDDATRARIIGQPRYIKGLGSIDRSEAGPYFTDPTTVTFTGSIEDKPSMDLCFNDKLSKQRFVWLQSIDATAFHPTIINRDVTLSDFVNKQLVVYHRMTFRRALPCLYDGFKEASRKIFYTLRVKNYKDFQDMERIAGAVKEEAMYHHGAKSITDTAAVMGYPFVGYNNARLVQTWGGSGTRLHGGSDHAQGRYLKAKLDKLAVTLFNKEDDEILERVTEDGMVVEPVYYAPIIPTLLCNGAFGIATGTSSNIPCCNPKQLIEYYRIWIKNLDTETPAPLPTIVPWYQGFKGNIVMSENGANWVSTGIIQPSTHKDYKGWWEITELPVGVWTRPYFVDKVTANMCGGDGKSTPIFSDAVDDSTDEEVLIRVKPVKDFIPSITTVKGLAQLEHLTSMVVVNEHDIPRKYNSLNEIAHDFGSFRIKIYEKRRLHIIKKLKDRFTLLKNKVKFVVAARNGSLDTSDEESMIKYMEDNAFMKVNESYNYLLDTPVRRITDKVAAKMREEMREVKAEHTRYKSTTAAQLWLMDLDDLEKQL